MVDCGVDSEWDKNSPGDGGGCCMHVTLLILSRQTNEEMDLKKINIFFKLQVSVNTVLKEEWINLPLHQIQWNYDPDVNKSMCFY